MHRTALPEGKQSLASRDGAEESLMKQGGTDNRRADADRGADQAEGGGEVRLSNEMEPRILDKGCGQGQEAASQTQAGFAALASWFESREFKVETLPTPLILNGVRTNAEGGLCLADPVKPLGEKMLQCGFREASLFHERLDAEAMSKTTNR
jgi:hypothetical protein